MADQQRTEQWYEDRRGRLTASRMHRLMNGTHRGINSLLDALQREIDEGKGGWIEGRDIDAEAMAWGREQEPRAVALYEMKADVDVIDVGLIKYPAFDFIAASPDGIVFPDAPNKYSLEIKCPKNPENHQLALIYGMPVGHRWQVQTQSLCIEVDHVEFVSYDPRESMKRRMYREIIKKNPEDHKRILDKAHWMKDLLDKGDRVDLVPEQTPQFF